MDFPTFLIQLLNSVQYGLLLFMLAAGLTLIFGIMGVVNPVSYTHLTLPTLYSVSL